MSADSTLSAPLASSPAAPATPQRETWPTLRPEARRVLGVLIEKGKTTPDSYPLTLNSLISGCNQKSARDPVTDYTDVEVEEGMGELKKLGYAQQLMGGGRSDKYRHNVYEACRVDKVQIAILGELLLRGPQTVGDLRGRANRMEPIADLEALREPLRLLAARGLVVFLTPEGQRGAAVAHGFHAPEELARAKARFAGQADGDAAPPTARSATPAAANVEARLAVLEAAVAALRQEVAALKG